MKKSLRFLSLAVITAVFAGNAAYAQNNSSLASGETKLKAGNHHEAIADFTQAIEHNHSQKLSATNLAKAYLDRGLAKQAIGESEAANADFKKAIEVDPTPSDAKAYTNRGLAKSALGDSIGAQSDFKRADSFDDMAAQPWTSNNG